MTDKIKLNYFDETNIYYDIIESIRVDKNIFEYFKGQIFHHKDYINLWFYKKTIFDKILNDDRFTYAIAKGNSTLHIDKIDIRLRDECTAKPYLVNPKYRYINDNALKYDDILVKTKDQIHINSSIGDRYFKSTKGGSISLYKFHQDLQILLNDIKERYVKETGDEKSFIELEIKNDMFKINGLIQNITIPNEFFDFIFTNSDVYKYKSLTFQKEVSVYAGDELVNGKIVLKFNNLKKYIEEGQIKFTTEDYDTLKMEEIYDLSVDLISFKDEYESILKNRHNRKKYI